MSTSRRLTILTALTALSWAPQGALRAQQPPDAQLAPTPEPSSASEQAPTPDQASAQAPSGPWAERSAQLLYEGDVFYMEGDYYRAITQYKLHMMYDPLHPGRDELRLKIAWIYAQGQKQAAAARQLAELILSRPEHDRLALWATLYYAQAALDAGQGELASRSFERVLASCSERDKIVGQLVGRLPPLGRRFELVSAQDCQALAQYARVGLARLAVAMHDFKAATRQLELIPQESPAADQARRVAAYVDALELPSKSPALAGVLSIVPGLGHMYIEEYGAGVTALLWNGVFIYAVVDSIVAGRYGQASLLGLVELIWYSGTIFGAVSGAHRFNRDARRIVEDGLTRDLDVLDDRSPWTQRFHMPQPQLQLQLSF